MKVRVSAPLFLGLPDNMPVAYFKFSPDTQDNEVNNATLRFFVRKPENFNENADPIQQLTARLYEITDASGTVRFLIGIFNLYNVIKTQKSFIWKLTTFLVIFEGQFLLAVSYSDYYFYLFKIFNWYAKTVSKIF